MRRAVLLAVLASLLTATPAAAHRFPAACTANAGSLTLTKDRQSARPGDVVTFSIFAANDGAGACDITNAGVDLQLPGPTGAPGAPATITSGQPLPAGTPPTKIADVPYTVAVNAGVADAVLRATATGTVHDSPADTPATLVKDLGTTITQPGLSLAFTANPLTGFAPLSFAFEYVVTNTSTTPVPMSSVAISVPPQGGCAPITRVGGDTNGNNTLDNGEAWRHTCPSSLPLPGSLTTGAVATARSDVDNAPVSAGESKVTVTAQAPPRPVLTLTRGATPNGPAPLAVTYSYAVRNDSVADARPVKDVSIDDPGCPGATRTSAPDDLLQRGETWTFSCTRVLATAGTVSGTAIAKGKDDLLNIDAWSDPVSLEVTATATAPAPTPIPTPTPEEPTTDPTPTPSTRVNLATSRGTISRCTTRSATAQLKVGKRVIATKRFRLDRRCRYTVRFTDVTRSKLRGATRVTVTVRAGKRTRTHRLSVPRR